MKEGYTPTSYGQISQIAQIYKEFGIDTITFYRGITPDEYDTEYILGSRMVDIETIIENVAEDHRLRVK
ncbi:MAG: hypothetical protein COT45_05910 [bacterium (Candidatus Stahlbacteria) CG08_land_8_20_14_0_20_40_26]|nr:MAG: hypothetical protein COX49_09925 [bacterium (Candidatus Stahlbacteria) CG23_combo_of_CG06-09_8_20_14_all_40_9]PIS23581.1 MAG: hypothetical protein COT45_05910 [bacterium (Candidatus Stahlbacteria) CG08_land_8_20_14_0_20_40_26]